MFNIEQSFQKTGQIICKEMDEGGFLIDPYRRTVIKLNPVAHKIWKLLDDSYSASQIITILKEEFEVEEKVLHKDVVHFLKELLKREMIS